MHPPFRAHSPLCFAKRVAVALHLSGVAFMAVPIVGCDAETERAAISVASATASLPEPRTVRFVRLEQLTEWNGKAWASVAEFNLIDSTGAVVDRSAWKASADSAGVSDQAANAIDGDPKSLWHTRWDDAAPPVPPHALTIDLGRSVRVSGFRYLPRQDRTVNGTIAKYRFFVSADGVDWATPVVEDDFTTMSGPTVEKTVMFAAQTANRSPTIASIGAQTTAMGRAASIRVDATDADSDLLSFAASGLPPGVVVAPKTGLITGTPVVPGTYAVAVSVADRKGPDATVAFAWTVRPPADDGVPTKAGEVRFVKLEEVTEVNGNPWASIAEFNLIGANGATLPRDGWLASADSADTSDGPNNAIDGNVASIWHSQWDGTAPPPPHSFIVDLGRASVVRGFRYLPRQDKVSNGAIARFRFFVSADGVSWGRPVAEGDFSTMGQVREEKTVLLK
jgi:hypothetical protein